MIWMESIDHLSLIPLSCAVTPFWKLSGVHMCVVIFLHSTPLFFTCHQVFSLSGIGSLARIFYAFEAIQFSLLGCSKFHNFSNRLSFCNYNNSVLIYDSSLLGSEGHLLLPPWCGSEDVTKWVTSLVQATNVNIGSTLANFVSHDYGHEIHLK